MVKCFFNYNKDNIVFFKIYGHANSVKKGENDLVCSGISSIVFGILNSLEVKNNNILISLEENYIEIVVNDFSYKNQIILETLYNSLKTIENNNKKFLKINTNIISDVKER